MEEEYDEKLRLDAVASRELQVCIICLHTETLMLSMRKYNLEEAYQHLTGFPLSNVANLQHTVCEECALKLRNFKQFRDVSLRGRALMMELVRQHRVITAQHIANFYMQMDLNELSTNTKALVKTEPLLNEMDWCSGGGSSFTVKMEPALNNLGDSCSREDSAVDEKMKPSLFKQVGSRGDNVVSVKIEPFLHDTEDSCSKEGSAVDVKMEPSLHVLEVSCSGRGFVEALGTEAPHEQVSTRVQDTSALQHCRQWQSQCASLMQSAEQHFTSGELKQAVDEVDNNCDSNHNHHSDTTQHSGVDTEYDKPKPAKKKKEDKRKKLKTVQSTYANSRTQNYLDDSEKVYFSCDLCEYKCKYNSQLAVHKRIHSGDKPYSCEKCSYRCSQNSTLVLHMRTHSGVKPYSCTQCPYRCMQNSDLVRHRRTHAADKPFACSLCQYKCKDKSNLLRHVRAIHSK